MIKSRNWLPWRPLQLLVIFERVINQHKLGEIGGLVAEDAMKDVHEDVQKHAKAYHAHTRLVPRHQRHPWIILGQLWKSRTARSLQLPQSMRSREPRARLHPVQLPRLPPRPRGCIRLNRGSIPLSKLVSSCPWPSAARHHAIRTRRGR